MAAILEKVFQNALSWIKISVPKAQIDKNVNPLI